jgi:hypothetical protein
MTPPSMTRLIFRTWVRAHARPLSLRDLRPLWRESQRFAAGLGA